MPPQYKSIYRYSAFVAIIGVWVAFFIGMRQVGLTLTDSRPLSYLGISSFAGAFRATLLIGLVCMGIFYVYLNERFKPTNIFRNLYFIGLVTQAIVACTPYARNGHFQWPHWTAAIALTAILVSSPWLFAASRRITESAARVSKGVTIFYVAVLIIETILLIGPHYYAASELFNVMIFHAWIIYLTFLPQDPVTRQMKI